MGQSDHAVWTTLRRAHKGTFHKLSPKHLDRYIRELAGKCNIRESGTLDQMRDTVARFVRPNLRYRSLVADDGLKLRRGRSSGSDAVAYNKAS